MNKSKLVVVLNSLITFSTFSPSAFAEDWRFFQETQNSKIYFDYDSITREKGLVKIKQRVVFESPRKTIIANPEYEYSEFISTEEYNCEKRVVTTIEQINITDDGKMESPEYVVSGSIPVIGPYMENSINFACSYNVKP